MQAPILTPFFWPSSPTLKAVETNPPIFWAQSSGMFPLYSLQSGVLSLAFLVTKNANCGIQRDSLSLCLVAVFRANTTMEQLDGIELRVKAAITRHNTLVDNWLFNGSTVLALFCSGAASILAVNKSINGSDLLTSVLAALAAFLVALERTLGFGARWRFHLELRNSYEAILDLIELHKVAPDDEKIKIEQEIWTALRAARAREAAIPSGSSPSVTP
jgi:hypothetical protein